MSTGQIFHSEGIRIEDLPREHLGSISIYPKRAPIWHSGETLDGIYFVRRGRVELVVEDARKRRCIIRIVQPGEPFGLDCFRSALPRVPVTAVASVRSEILKVKCNDFLAFIRANQKAEAALLASMSEFLSYVEERLRIVLNHDAEDRLCALLDQLTERFGRPGTDESRWRRLYLTHEELAGFAGLSRSHVSLVMARLRSAGIVGYGRSKPLVVDTAALARRRNLRASNPPPPPARA